MNKQDMGTLREKKLKNSIRAKCCDGAKKIVLLYALGALAVGLCAETHSDVRAYLESLAKSDGGYGWPEQSDSFAEVTFAVVGVYHAIGEAPPNPERTAAAVMRNPFSGETQETRPHSVQPLHLFYQQMQTLAWLGKSTDPAWHGVSGLVSVPSYQKAYETGGNPPMDEVSAPIRCRMIRKARCDDLKENYLPYFVRRRRANGTYNTTPAIDGGDGHVVNTYHGLLAELAFEGRCGTNAVAWIENCRQKDGGFSWSPNPQFGGVSDMYYVWHAVKALRLMGTDVAEKESLMEWVRSLRNADGGFADRPGAPSSPIATYWVADTFPELLREPAPPAKEGKPEDLRGLRAWTIQFEAPGSGSVADAVELARTLKIHLWGAKNSSRAWIEAAQKKADEKGVRVLFFASNEEYGTMVSVPGVGCFTHANDPVAPQAELPRWMRRGGTWGQFREEKIQPLNASGGLMIWQISDHETFGRIVLDDSLLRGGYSLLSTFHFGCHNMACTTPYLMRYRHEIPMIALQDSHGEAWWWRRHLEKFKTIFLAESPTWGNWMKAVSRNHVAAVRRDCWTFGKTRMLGGSRDARGRFWDLRGDWEAGDVAEAKEDVSVVVVRSTDVFEPGRPKCGSALRIRLNREWIEGRQLWFNDDEITLERVAIDGKEAKVSHDVRFVEEGWLKGKVEEDSYYVALPKSCGRITACFRFKNGKSFCRTLSNSANVDAGAVFLDQ